VTECEWSVPYNALDVGLGYKMQKGRKVYKNPQKTSRTQGLYYINP